MAKWGEGDPRWIVEERPDATNVNNWHWTEKNATPWSHEKIRALFKGVKIPSEIADLEVLEADQIAGEASANNRKAKLIFFYEWNVTLKWQGRLHGGSGEMLEGKINIPNLSEENDISEVDITVTLVDTGEEAEVLKQIVHTTGKSVVRDLLQIYVRELKEEFSKGMILPKKDDQSHSADNHVNNLSSGFNKKINMTATENDKGKARPNPGLKVATVEIKQKNTFQCTVEQFYDALTKPEMVVAFTKGEVKLEANVGGEFSLFGGNITGRFEELVPGQKIVQKWRYKQWPEGVTSTVKLDIIQKSDHTEVRLHQTGVPASEAEITKNNWDRYYWDAMKRTFGFGAFFT